MPRGPEIENAQAMQRLEIPRMRSENRGVEELCPVLASPGLAFVSRVEEPVVPPPVRPSQTCRRKLSSGWFADDPLRSTDCPHSINRRATAASARRRAESAETHGRDEPAIRYQALPCPSVRRPSPARRGTPAIARRTGPRRNRGRRASPRASARTRSDATRGGARSRSPRT